MFLLIQIFSNKQISQKKKEFGTKSIACLLLKSIADFGWIGLNVIQSGISIQGPVHSETKVWNTKDLCLLSIPSWIQNFSSRTWCQKIITLSLGKLWHNGWSVAMRTFAFPCNWAHSTENQCTPDLQGPYFPCMQHRQNGIIIQLQPWSLTSSR